MKIRHINSGEESTLINGLIYTKRDGIYGYLTVTFDRQIYFIYNHHGDEERITLEHVNVTKEYEIIE